MNHNLMNSDVSRIMQRVSDYAPTALLIMAVGTFMIVGTFRTDYYHHIFDTRFPDWGAWAMAIFAATIEEGVRLALLVSSIRDFSDNRKGNGWLGLIGSVGLVVYEVGTAQHVAGLWADGGQAAQSIYHHFIVFMIVLGLLLELRLILTTNGTSLGKPTPGRNRATSNGAHALANLSQQ